MLNLKLKAKLLLALFLVTALSAGATTLFSIYYFSDNIRLEAQENMRKNAQVAERIFANLIKEIESDTEALADDGTLQLLTGLGITVKLNNYLTDSKKLFERVDLHDVIVTDGECRIIGHVTAPAFIRFQDELRKNIASNLLLSKVLREQRSFAAAERIPATGGDLITITAAAPVFERRGLGGSRRKNDGKRRLVGIVLVRHVFNGSTLFVEEIHKLLGVDAALFREYQPISYKTIRGGPPHIKANIYQALTGNPGSREDVEMRKGGHLAEYKTLTDVENTPIGVLGVSISADKYIALNRHAIFTLVVIMLACIVAAGVTGYLLARSILVPIQQLMDGVLRVTSGELSHEIPLELKDELGVLAGAFNSMSRQLNNLFNTLEQRVQDATRKVQNALTHLTAIIDNMADGLVVTDRHNKIIRINPALSMLFPGRQEILGKPCAELDETLAHLAERAQHSTAAPNAEIALSGRRYGHATAIAIIRKDSFGDEVSADDTFPTEYAGSVYLGSVILIRDITRDKAVDAMMKNTINTLTRVGTALGAETDIRKRLALFVTEARKAAYADGAILYLLRNNQLHCEVVENESMGIHMDGPVNLPPLDLDESKIAAYAAIHKQILQTPDVDQHNQFDFSAIRQDDTQSDYQTNAMLVVPLLNGSSNTVGVLQLINPVLPWAGVPNAFENNRTEIVASLAGQAAAAVEKAFVRPGLGF